LNLALWTLWSSLKALRRPVLVLPLFIYAVIQALILLALVNFHLPPWVGVLAPLVKGLYGDGATHYPVLFIVLPNLFNFVNMFLAAIVGVYLWGVGILVVARYIANAHFGGWQVAWKRYGHLFLAQLPVVLFAILMFVMPREIFPGAQDLSGNALRAFRYGMLGLGILVESLFLFAPLAVLVERRAALPAIARSIGIWRSNLLAALLVVGIPTIIHLPMSYIYRHAPSVVARFSPETVAFIMGVDIALFLLTNFLVLFAGTTIFLERREDV